VGAILGGIQANAGDPPFDDSGVLPCRDMFTSIDTTGKQIIRVEPLSSPMTIIPNAAKQFDQRLYPDKTAPPNGYSAGSSIILGDRGNFATRSLSQYAQGICFLNFFLAKDR
jgi:hypothetical protein